MKYNTRFNPTISGPLHIGHLYMVLVNAAEAHRTGGKFTIRIDDTQPYWNHWIKEDQRNKYYEDYQEQLNQFEEIDVWERQSQMLIPEEIIGEHPLLKKYSRFVWMETSNIEWRTAINQKIMPYCPNHTLEKVVWDFWEDVNLLISQSQQKCARIRQRFISLSSIALHICKHTGRFRTPGLSRPGSLHSYINTHSNSRT